MDFETPYFSKENDKSIYRGTHCSDIHLDCMDFIAPSLVGQKLNLDNENPGTLKSYVIASTRFMDPSSVNICAGYLNSTLCYWNADEQSLKYADLQ